MQPQEISLDVLAEKYAKGEERSFEDIAARVARGIGSSANSVGQPPIARTRCARHQRRKRAIRSVP